MIIFDERNLKLFLKLIYLLNRVIKHAISHLYGYGLFLPWNPLKPKKENKMKVIITDQCMGDRNCNKLCPEVFEYDEDQLKSTVKFDKIPEQYKAVVRQAAAECGADAIEIMDDDE